MDYLKPFTYFVSASGGVVNLLLCAVCQFIPVVGPIVLLGYRAEVAVELVRDRKLRRHPAFDFGRFGDYLGRGVWPFVYQLAAGLVLFAAFFGLAVAAAGVMASVQPVKDPTGVVILAAFVWLIVMAGVIVGTAFFVWPMELHAQLSERFAPGEAVGFAGRFVGLMWGQLLVSLGVFVVGSFLLVLLGILAFGVGVYLAVVVQFMAQQHLMSQLYRLYLEAGGDPIRGPDDDFDD